MNPSKGVVISKEFAGQRLDKVLADVFTDVSRSSWAKRIKNGQVLVNGEEASPDYSVAAGDPITVAKTERAQANYKIPIIYEDEQLLVINKPAGVLVHAKGREHEEVTVVDYFKEKLPKDGTNRPGVIHRLDRGTSGVMCLAKDHKALIYLQKQFSSHKVQKIYYAMISGVPKDKKAKLLWPIARNPKKPASFTVAATGRTAQTDYELVKTDGKKTLVKLLPKTGRTHQLRVHLQKLGFPIIGDSLYGGQKAKRLMLHAQGLTLRLPSGHSKKFEAPLPEEFKI